MTTGASVRSQTFLPWGTVRSGAITVTKRNYTGQYRDGTGLLYYHARYYDPVLGRFISPDTLVPGPTDPQDLNRYSYAKNNPMRYTDPTGHRSCAAGACFEGGAQMGGPINPGAGSAGQAALNVGTVIVYVTQAGARVTDAVGEFVTAITSGEGAAAPDGSVGGAGEGAGAAGAGATTAEGDEPISGNVERLPDDELLSPSKRGNAPVSTKDDKPIEIHHVGQKPEGPFKEMTQTDHRGPGNFAKNHHNTGQSPSQVDRREWKRQQRQYWRKEWDRGRGGWNKPE